MAGLEKLVERAPVFADLAPAHIETIAGCARNERVQAGSLLLREGDAANTFYLIRSGTVALEVHAPGGPLMIQTLHEHEVVGWSWLFAPYRWQTDGRALTDCALLAFDAACLRAKCEADHELGFQLMRRFASIISERLQATRLQLLDLYGQAAGV
jgi:CRP/FNR family transcriptional regulator, cyclic AMP receptor protein